MATDFTWSGTTPSPDDGPLLLQVQLHLTRFFSRGKCLLPDSAMTVTQTFRGRHSVDGTAPQNITYPKDLEIQGDHP